MLIVDVSEVKLPGEAKQSNLPPECGQPIDGGLPVFASGVGNMLAANNDISINRNHEQRHFAIRKYAFSNIYR
jgi:hypothetical protein